MIIEVVDGRAWQKHTRCLCLWHDTPQLVVLGFSLESCPCHAYEQSYTILAKMVERGGDEHSGGPRGLREFEKTLCIQQRDNV